MEALDSLSKVYHQKRDGSQSTHIRHASSQQRATRIGSGYFTAVSIQPLRI